MKTGSKLKFVALMGALVLVGAGCTTAVTTDVTVDTDSEAMMDTEDMMAGDTMLAGDDAHMDDDMIGGDAMPGDGGGSMMGEDEDADGDVSLEGSLDLTIDPNAKVFEVTATNFAYDVTEIRVKKGDTVTIAFTAGSGFHDWVIDEFDAATAQVRDGGTSQVTFVADKEGTFEYYCSVGRHRQMGMVGKLIVE